MMAFFLVMWLVNANEDEALPIATYFNRSKLTDEKPTEKRLEKACRPGRGRAKKSRRDQDRRRAGQARAAAVKTGPVDRILGDETKYSDADFFENPYSVLAEIAQEVGQQATSAPRAMGGGQRLPSTGADGGEAYRDPFDPDFWTKQVEVNARRQSRARRRRPEGTSKRRGRDYLALKRS